MLDKVLRELGWYKRPNNQYVASVKFGLFEIKDGSIAPSDFLEDGDYFRIIGSKRNDGLHQYPSGELTDELFDGAVWVMRIPPDVIAIAQKIKEYTESDAAQPSAYTSESFGGYSYTKATGANGEPLTWEGIFKKDLNAWRLL